MNTTPLGAVSSSGGRTEVEGFIADAPRLVRAWLHRRRALDLPPLAAAVPERVRATLAEVGRWLPEGGHGPNPDLHDAFVELILTYRDQHFAIDQILEDLLCLQDVLEDETRLLSSGVRRRLRRAVRELITEAGRVARSLDERRGREDADALEIFGDLVSHELGNRLGAARTGLDILEELPANTDSGRRADLIRLVSEGIDAAMETVDDVGIFTATYTGAREDRLPFADVAGSVARGIRILARRQGVEIRVVEPLPGARVEASRVRLILSNLLVNGVRYAQEERDERWVALEAEEVGGDLTVRVSDNGVGIPPESRHSVFRYRQRGPARDQYRPGSGLGLAVVREALEQLGGAVTLESRVGVGTTFTLRIPLTASEGVQDLS